MDKNGISLHQSANVKVVINGMGCSVKKIRCAKGTEFGTKHISNAYAVKILTGVAIHVSQSPYAHLNNTLILFYLNAYASRALIMTASIVSNARMIKFGILRF